MIWRSWQTPTAYAVWASMVLAPIVIARIVAPTLLSRLKTGRALSGILLTAIVGGIAFMAATEATPTSFAVGAALASALGSVIIFPVALILLRFDKASWCFLTAAVAVALWLETAAYQWSYADLADPVVRAIRSLPETIVLAGLLVGAFAIGAHLSFCRISKRQ